MPLQFENESRSLELTGLIDVVFLLMIFFLVSFAFSLASDVSESQVHSEMDLPTTKTNLPQIKDDWLENLMIQIVPDTSELQTAKKAYVLWPVLHDTTKISRGHAFEKALTDSTFAAFPVNFVNMPEMEFKAIPPCTLISNSIDRYIEYEKMFRGNTRPVIELRADKNTEFKILSYIMDRCSLHEDVVPQIVIRTSHK
ncbi:MAG: ExbD/TolR family protein [bacterium]